MIESTSYEKISPCEPSWIVSPRRSFFLFFKGRETIGFGVLLLHPTRLCHPKSLGIASFGCLFLFIGIEEGKSLQERFDFRKGKKGGERSVSKEGKIKRAGHFTCFKMRCCLMHAEGRYAAQIYMRKYYALLKKYRQNKTNWVSLW